MLRSAVYILLCSVLCLVLIGVSDSNTVQAKDTAMGIHIDAWIEVATKAASDPAYKYALYQARTLAVKHPEIYLQADALFNQILLSEENMARYYLNRTQEAFQHDAEYRSIRAREGGKFRWSSFSITNHNPVGYKDIYHTEAFLPFVDIRLHFMGSALKGTDWKATPLSMAEFLYFQNGAKNNPFLLVTEQGTAYLYTARGLFSKEKLLKYNGEEVEQIRDKVVLIFNQTYVWYPLMERDDREQSTTLAKLVETYAEENQVPKLTAKEKEIVELLKDNTSFSSRTDELFALAYAGKLHAFSWRYYPEIFKKLYPKEASEYGFNRSHAPNFISYRNSRIAWISNLVSPITAELAAVARNMDIGYLDVIIAPMIREYLKHVETYNGRTGLDLWFHSELHYLNLDDNLLTKAANCIYSATNTAAMLDLAEIPDLEIIVTGLKYKNRSGGHTYTVVFKAANYGTLENGGWAHRYNGLYEQRHFSE